MPMGVFDSGNEKLTVKALARLNAEQGSEAQAHNSAGRAESIVSTLSTLSIRPKGETPEERKERKKLVKEYRRVSIPHHSLFALQSSSVMLCTYCMH